MDFRFSPEEDAWRQEVRDFLHEQLPDGWHGHNGDTLMSFPNEWVQAVAFAKRLSERGWIAPHWPKEYGGSGMSIMQQVIYNEEMATFNAPIVNGPGVGMVGPVIILHGTEAQKRRYLPKITALEEIWCQGYSEPGAGSDLASLQTRAVADGDDFVVNGQKIWTTNGHRADWMVLLARTDPDAPKHRGISMFLLNMKTPGITVQPLPNMANLHTFNQVFFDNVRVPKENLVGEENRGFYVGLTLLDFERSNVAGGARAKRELQRIADYCRETKRNGGRLIDEPRVRSKLAELAIEIEVGRYISYRVASLQARGLVPSTEASCAKLYHSELSQRMANATVNIMGLAGQLRPEAGHWAPMGGRDCIHYMEVVPATIAAGSSEIQRNIIATRGLGLPRD